MAWEAEITGNTSDDEYELYIELLEDGEYRGRIQRADDGSIVLIFYPSSDRIAVPATWLSELLAGAVRDFP